MILNSRQTVVMMIPKTPIEYITMTETSLKDEMTVTGEPSCGGKPPMYQRNQHMYAHTVISMSDEHLLGHTVKTFSPSRYNSDMSIGWSNFTVANNLSCSSEETGCFNKDHACSMCEFIQ